MPKTLFEKFFQFGFEMTFGKFEHYEERFTNFQKLFSLLFFNKNSPKYQISKPCGLFWKMQIMYMKIYERNLSHSKDNEYI